MAQLIHVLEAHLNDFYLITSNLSEISLQVFDLSASFSRVVSHWNLLKLLQLSKQGLQATVSLQSLALQVKLHTRYYLIVHVYGFQMLQ